jgi:hypothetical protein
MTGLREQLAQALERGDDLEAEVLRRRMNEQLNQNPDDGFRPLSEIDLPTDQCPRCQEAECCCKWLPCGWGAGAHPAYLAYARRQRGREGGR